MPMSRRRVIVLGASLVCSVLNTMWPVSEACTAISAVSRSRISPTRILSGSCRRMARRHWANVLPIAASIGTWTMPSMSYSTGSSVVISLSSISFNSLERRVERGGLARAGRPGDQHDAVGLVHRPRGTRFMRGRVHADLVQVERHHRAVEHPHDHAFAEHGGQHADAQVDRVAADGQLDAAVLRHAPLGDVEVGHHLDAGGDGERQVARRRHHFVQHAVGLDADAELVLERLEVQVAGVVLDGQQQHHVQQLADRGAVGQGLDAGQVDRPVADRPLRPRRPAPRRSPCPATRLSTLSLLAA